jgi:hypothetical protein
MDPAHEGPYLKRLLDTLMVRNAGVSASGLQLELLNAAHNFYTQSLAWRAVLEVYMNLAAPAVTYPVPVPAGSEVCHIFGGTYKGRCIGNVNQTAWRTDIVEGDPLTVDGDIPGTVTVRPSVSDDTNPLYLTVALRPTALEGLDDAMVGRHFSALLAYCQAALAAQPNKPWTSDKVALLAGREAMAHLARERAAADQHYVHGQGVWRFPNFATQRRLTRSGL